MSTEPSATPEQLEALKAALAEAQGELAVAKAKAAEDRALIAHQKFEIAKLRRELYGPRSERTARLIEQLALLFEELSASATEDELAAERAVAKTTSVAAFTRKRAERQTFPEHLPRERVVMNPLFICEPSRFARSIVPLARFAQKM